MKKQSQLADIRAFVVLVEQGSFTRAGEKLLCSRSHISRQLVQLEADLGVTLLIRTTRTQHLTPQGKAFYERCKASLGSIAHAVDRAMESADSLVGNIKINCVGGYIAEDIVSALINDFMLQYPDISIELDFSSARVNLITGEYDFVFRMGELEDSGLIARKLTDIQIATYASKAYLQQFGHPRVPAELASHRCIAGSVNPWVFNRRGTDKKQEVLIDGNLVCRNGRIMVNSACAGNGIIRVPEFYCREQVRQQQLVQLFDDWEIESIPLYLVYNNDRHQPARLRAFVEFVITHFATYLR